MKKLLGIVVLGLLLASCSELVTEQRIENCADTSYSKADRKDFGDIYNYIIAKEPKNSFERFVHDVTDDGVSLSEIIKYMGDMASDKPRNVQKSHNLAEDARAAVQFANNETRKFFNSSLEKKLKENLKYRSKFKACENFSQENPKTFNAMWKKKIIYYIKDIYKK